MPSIRVCALFRPLNSKEKADHGDTVSYRAVDSETFVFKDEKEEEIQFCFDRVFCEGAEQVDIYEFLGLPIVKGIAKGVNGALITYGQTGAGKTYSMEGPNIGLCNQKQKGLLPRVVDGLFNVFKQSDLMSKCTIKLSMVEIYMERVRDLLDLSKDNLQIKESKVQGIFVSGVTEISISDSTEALQSLSKGIANRAVGETQMNMTSSRSHCIYIFLVQQQIKNERRSGKLFLVDLAGSEKAEKTGAEGRVLEEAKFINKSLSALGNVINALTCESAGRVNHIPYRDSKLTRILQDALGGKSQTALLCCCSPSPSNASESLSTLRFGARAKHIKALLHINTTEDEDTNALGDLSLDNPIDAPERILEKISQRMNPEDVQLLEQLFILDGIFFNPYSVEEIESAYEDVTSGIILSLENSVEELIITIDKLKKENAFLKSLTKSWKGGKSQIALLCCCSNASESLSALRFGAKGKHVKPLPHGEDPNSVVDLSETKTEARERILEKLSQGMKPEDVQILEQLFVLEGIFFDPYSVEEIESAYESVTSETISSLQEKVQEFIITVDKLNKENQALKSLTMPKAVDGLF